MAYVFYVKIVLWLVKMCAEAFFLPVHVFRLFLKPKKCPPIRNELLLLSADELAKRIRQKNISSVTVVQAYISRINEVNPIINAVIENRFQDALNDAEKVDIFLQNTKLKEHEILEKHPLLGVPVTIKGSIAVKGMLHNAASLHHNVRAESDATAVQRIKNAGAIPLLISNIPELCLNYESTNNLVGTTSNPYDNTKSSGGSSGGEASLLGSGASVIGLGSDLAGSLRVPAHYCGIWGHKVSPQIVSHLGHYPEGKNKEEWKKLFTMGPLTRYATDLKLVLNIIAEPSGKDLLKLNEKVDLKKIKTYRIKSVNPFLSDPLNRNVAEAIENVVNHLNTLCDTKCTEVDLPYLKYCGELACLRLTLLDLDIDNFYHGKDAKIYYELLRFFMGKSNFVFGSLGYATIKHLINFLPKDTVNGMYMYFESLRKTFLKLLGDDGVLIIATSPTEAIYHKDAFRRMFDFGYCGIFNILGFPSTNCPIGFTANGLPVGIQVVAAPNLDRLTLSVAEELERKFGGWRF